MAEEMLKIEFTSFSHAPAMIVRGRYDISCINSFEESFKELVNKADRIVGLNLRDLTYIDSSGIGSLIRCYNIARKKDITCYFYDVNNDILTVFQLAKLDAFLKILTSEEFALRVSDTL